MEGSGDLGNLRIILIPEVSLLSLMYLRGIIWEEKGQ